MPVITKRSPRLSFEFVAARKQFTLGGLPAVEALAQQFDLWKKLRACRAWIPGCAPRTATVQNGSWVNCSTRWDQIAFPTHNLTKSRFLTRFPSGLNSWLRIRDQSMHMTNRLTLFGSGVRSALRILR
jgi:hypothetical protein